MGEGIRSMKWDGVCRGLPGAENTRLGKEVEVAKPGPARVSHDVLWEIRPYLQVEAAVCDANGPIVDVPCGREDGLEEVSLGFSKVSVLIQERAKSVE